MCTYQVPAVHFCHTHTLFSTVDLPFTLHSPVTPFWLTAMVAARKRERNVPRFVASQALKSTAVAKGSSGTEIQLSGFARGNS